MLSVLLWSCSAAAETHYEVDVAQAASRVLLVASEATCAASDCDFQLPVWNAVYQIRDFAQHVTGFEAERDGGEPLPSRMLGPSRWRVQAEPGQRVRIRYRYLADTPGPFGCSASSRHVFLNFAQILAYPVGRLREPMTVRFRNLPGSWRIALELPERDGVFQARHYDELVDAPAELSAFAERSFLLRGRRVRVVVDADPRDYDLDRLERTARAVAAAGAEIMQDVPFPSYTFIYHFREGGGGGMEHANSTAIDARAPCRECDLVGITAHEFFHLWNVKRIRPQSLEPIDYTRENITPSLWFCEGITSTYGSYIQLQAGLDTPGEFLQRLGDQITRYERLPARLTQSAEESSIAAWLERYPGYRRPSRSVSYYLKGQLAGYLLDLAIRRHSGNRRSLDDVMRRLNQEYAQQGKFFEDTGALERLASEAAGQSMREFFDTIIRRPAPVPWDRYLAYAGYRLASRSRTTATLRAEASSSPGLGLMVTEVQVGGPGEQAGLQTGDKLISVGDRAPERGLNEALAALDLKPGARMSLRVERRGRIENLTATPEFAEVPVFRIEELPQAGPADKAVRAGWLRQAPATSTKP